MTWVAWVAIGEGLALLGIAAAWAMSADLTHEVRRARLRKAALRADLRADRLMMAVGRAQVFKSDHARVNKAELMRHTAAEARRIADAIPVEPDAPDGRLSLPEST